MDSNIHNTRFADFAEFKSPMISRLAAHDPWNVDRLVHGVRRFTLYKSSSGGHWRLIGLMCESKAVPDLLIFSAHPIRL